VSGGHDGIERQSGPCPALERVAAAVLDDAVQPTGKALGLAECAQLAPRLDKRLLRGVLRVGGIAEHGERDAEDDVLKALDEPVERQTVALARPLNELARWHVRTQHHSAPTCVRIRIYHHTDTRGAKKVRPH
jgi:hypothetical protein